MTPMNFNLKNFPTKRQSQGTEYFAVDVDVWKDRFEAEIRQLLSKYEFAEKANPTFTNLVIPIAILKQILGEEIQKP